MLFSQSALIFQLGLIFKKLKYYTLRKENFSRKMFEVALAVNVAVNAANIRGAVNPLIVSRNKTILIQGFKVLFDMANSQLL